MPDSARTPLVAANWKMHKTTAEAADFFERFVGELGDLGGVEVAVAPPFTVAARSPSTTRAARRSAGRRPERARAPRPGRSPGEVSIPMLAELGVAGAIVGHSERRQLFGETDEALARKVPALLAAEMLPMLCVGETEAERDGGETEAVLRRQLDADLADVDDADLGRLVVAYEPIWAIGTGRTATPEQAEETIAFIRELLAARDAEAAAAVRILYGGSVKPANAAELFSQPIDRRRPGRRRVARPRRLRRDLRGARGHDPGRRGLDPGPVAVPGGPRRLGAGRARARQRRLAGRDAGVRRALGALSPHDPLGQRPRRRPARRPDGQLGGRATSTSAPAPSSSRTWPASTTPSPTARFFENEVLLAACQAARESPRGRLHLMGLVSDGGVHSGWTHVEALIELAAQEGVPDVVVHAFTDGRDTLPTSAPSYVSELERWLRHAGRVGTVSGRYYAMDRDRRWERTKLAYDAIVHAQGQRADGAAEAVAAADERDETDEFIRPTVIGDYDGAADGDVAIHFNFRPDRARQLVMALCEPDFDEFDRGDAPDIELTTLTSYRAEWTYPVAFPPREPEATLAEVLSREGIRQLHVAETEKYAHVTYFFNGGREQEWEGEEHRLVDSPRDVATYDERPEMSAEAAAREFTRALVGRRLPVRDHQLRQPRHGRAHRQHPRGGDRDRGRRRAASARS